MLRTMPSKRFLRKRHAFLYILIQLFALIFAPTGTAASSQKPVESGMRHPHHVIFLPLYSVGIEIFENPQLPAFQHLAKLGAVGLLTMNTQKSHGPWDEYASYSAGAPMHFAEPIIEAEKNAEENQTNVPNLPLHWFQQPLHTPIFSLGIGGMHECLRKSGLVCMYAGPVMLNRGMFEPASLFSVDKDGKVSRYGNEKNGHTYRIQDRFAAGGMIDAVPKLLDDVSYFLHSKQSGLLTIGMGDLEAIEHERSYFSENQYRRLRLQALERTNEFIWQTIRQLTADDTLIVAGVTIPSEQARTHEWLAPIAIIGPNIKGDSSITSDTTRQKGIAANFDLVPTIFRQLQIHVPQTLGSPIHTFDPVSSNLFTFAKDKRQRISNMQTLQHVYQLNTWYTTNRPLLVGIFSAFVFGCLILWLLSINGWLRIKSRWFSLLCYVCSELPTAFLLMGRIQRLLFEQLNWKSEAALVLYVGMTLFLAVLIALPAIFLQAWENKFLYLSVVAVFVQSVLLLLHDSTFSQSLFGYDPVNGARYYGIGNEYAAGFISAWLMILVTIFKKCGKVDWLLGWIGSVGVVAFLASPIFGANIGGGLTVGVGSSLLLYRMGRNVQRWNRAFFLGSLAATVVFTAVLQIHPGFSVSHGAHFIRWAEQKNWSAISEIIRHKIQMNVNMIAYAPFWISMCICALLLFFGYLYTNHPVYRQWKKEKHSWQQLFPILVITSIVGGIVNDSGILVSFLMVYPAFWIGLGAMNMENYFYCIPFKKRIAKRFNKWFLLLEYRMGLSQKGNIE
ncbi:hypothetical protein LSG31_08525 [Fodinisporobacter ferrooxydans]|uniref:Uncharacterized protein n=1 Tax=Fodinisporobacter ferrooxydans TaxID=2901836 RepID=A0ABY4CNY2_9BACL|nr:hypothetical protein LSG31_08525 [Alicyclobacillaceae bacterium MYW30-H2]